MLAISHHIIVQWAAYVCGASQLGKWYFKDYVVLGDDIVIFDPKVAHSYYYIMTKILGVEIGLAKSLVSKNSWTLEFAKKFFVDGKRAFYVPFRDIIVTTLSTSVMSEFMRKHDYSFSSYLKLRGSGFKARSKVLANV